MVNTRGLVVSLPMKISGTTLEINSIELDPQEIRTSLLFWDKLDFPEAASLRIGLTADSQFLASAGVLQRTRISTPFISNVSELVLDAHLAAFRALDQEEPGQWSLAAGDKAISFPKSEMEVGRGVLVRLYNAIPVPDKDVALADLLAFRDKRRSELLAVRHHIEAVYQKIITAGDGPLALNSEIGALEAAIADHIRISKESRFKLRLSDLSANLNLVPAAVVGFTSLTMGMPLLQSLIAGGAAASMSIDVGAALKGRQAVSNPFRYVTSYHKDVFAGP
ncbi:DUF6236 family protein [Mesorhizobium sp. M0643]|uniref:DUF6236 family protein n=1 Tax=Mesorhizobium sp. M0643 TaxID=2956978 RepID=UPI003339A788